MKVKQYIKIRYKHIMINEIRYRMVKICRQSSGNHEGWYKMSHRRKQPMRRETKQNTQMVFGI